MCVCVCAAGELSSGIVDSQSSGYLSSKGNDGGVAGPGGVAVLGNTHQILFLWYVVYVDSIASLIWGLGVHTRLTRKTTGVLGIGKVECQVCDDLVDGSNQFKKPVFLLL